MPPPLKDFSKEKYFLRFEFTLQNNEASKKGDWVDSPTSIVGQFPCCLRIFPKSTKSGPSDHIAVFVAAQPPANWAAGWEFKDVHYEICLLCRGRQDHSIRKKDTHTFKTEQVDRGWHDFTPITWQYWKANGHTNDKRELCFQASVWGDFLGRKPEQADYSRCGVAAALWSSMRFCDAALVPGEGGTEVRCHRAVLAFASKVFERMLDGAFQEGASARIVLSDASEADVRGLLEWIYTGTLPIGADCIKLCKFADMYDMPQLAVTCGMGALHAMEASNVRQVLKALRKRGPSVALDAIYESAKRQVCQTPGLLDALVDAD